MDKTRNIASSLIDCPFHTGWRDRNWVSAGLKEGVLHLAGDASHHCDIKCGTRPSRISKRRIISPYFCNTLSLKNALGSQAGLPLLLQSELGPGVLVFSEGAVMLLHHHNKSSQHLGSCDGVKQAYLTGYLWMNGTANRPAAAYRNVVLYLTWKVSMLLPNVLLQAN